MGSPTLISQYNYFYTICLIFPNLIAEEATEDTNNFADIKNEFGKSQGENLSKSVTNKPINLEVTAPIKSNKLHMCFFHIFCAVYHLSMSN